jgi:hypothetical protein
MHQNGTVCKVRATSWGWTQTANGNAQFGMAFTMLGVADPDNPAAPLTPCEPGTGRWSITPTTEKSMEWLIATVQSLGYDRDDLLGLDPEGKGAFDFTGKEFLVRAKHHEYNGQTRVDWSVIVPRERPKLPAEKLAALNRVYGNKVMEAKERKAKAVAVTAAASGKDLPY